MKKNVERVPFWLPAIVLAALLTMAVPSANAQGGWSQSTACPGWNNPLNFTQGMGGSTSAGTYHGWEGRTGVKGETVPNALTGETGITWSSTVVTASQMANKQMNIGTSSSYPDCARFPGPSTDATHSKCFAILDTNTQCTGYTANRDPNTGSSASNQLWYVPTWYNVYDSTASVQTNLYRSVRVGHACGRESGTDNASAVYYYMNVTPQNAMLYLYYACVFESPSHTNAQNPVFIIRVMKQNSAGTWVQASPTGYYPGGTNQCDTLAYMISSTLATSGGSVTPGSNGWHSHTSTIGYRGGSQSLYWKDWTKVVLNLSSLLYSNVRIEVMVTTCSMTQHYSYAYICGECRPMKIESSGCPAGMSTDVTTLTAPRGLISYSWAASEYGYSEVSNLGLANSDPNSTAYFTFRELTSGTEEDTAYVYHVQADDFRVSYRPNSAHVQGIPVTPTSPLIPDSIGNKQVFRCTMESYIDPAKHFFSDMYVGVQNTKPTMDVDSLIICGGDVYLRNRSYVPGDPDLVDLPSTKWSFYHNASCLGTADTVMFGDTVTMHFDSPSMQGVRVRTNTHTDGDEECYSEAVYPIRPLQNPVGGFTVSPQVLCDDDPTTLVDTTSNSTYRVWMFRDADENSSMDLTDHLVGVGENNRTYSRSFTHSVEPIELMARNGKFYLNPENTSDTIWCENTIRDSAFVFLHPELEVVGDTIVCHGTLTDATVTAVGVDDCVYQWSTTLGSITGNIPQGNHLAVTPYADTATYYVRVTSPQGCVAWDSIHAYLVTPRLSILPADGRICPGDVVTLTGSNANSYTWSASPDDPSLEGQEAQDVIMVTPRQNTTYTLVGHGGSGDNLCDATPLTTDVTVFPYPVPQVHLNPGIIDSENPVVVLRDDSPYSVTSSWVFDGGETVNGQEVTHSFEESTGADSVYVTLINANELGCQTVYPFAIPVNLYTAWFPNVFTPGSEDENSRFRLYTINAYEHFHIYIYNRRGELVFDSDDPEFVWDGTYNGTPCPQDTYVYICRFRKPGTYNLSKIHGSVTLVR